MKLINKLKDEFFNKIHSTNLIYNACWEDPAIDRELLNFAVNEEIVMITSAGCNALDYLLDSPKAIHCIDVNPRQNALLELKLALLKHSDYQTLFSVFGKAFNPNFKTTLNSLESHLSPFANAFWNKKSAYFLHKKRPFYFNATSGNFAWGFCNYLKYKGAYKLALQLLDAKSLDEQKEIYKVIESKIFTGFTKWLMGRHVTMSLLGVPRPQRQLLLNDYEEGVAGFLKEALNHVFTEIPIDDNYFWRAYITGSYTVDCSPNYLKEKHFDTLKNQCNKIHSYTSTISQFLKDNPKVYQQYILLDHQDWLAANSIAALNEEWNLILANSAKGTKILMRSAAREIDFIPDFAKDKLDIKRVEEPHFRDRVGTYGSCYLCVVR